MNKTALALGLSLSVALMSGCKSSDEHGRSSAATQAPTAGQVAGESERSIDLPASFVSTRPLPASQADLLPASCDDGERLRGGRNYRVEMPSRVDAAAIVFQVFEPTLFDCEARHPLILEGHGFSGNRQTAATDSIMSPIKSLVDAGYTVISIDQRGHGESGGTIRVMDPDYEGQDLIQIVDWAEAHLDYLAYRDGSLLLGGVGGSYGGGFQYLLYNMDPDQRMKAMVPHITWHDLTYSLAPGRAPKGFWALFLSAAGDANTGFGMDPILRASLLDGLVTSRFNETAKDFLYYHSPSYFWHNTRELELLDSGNTSHYLLDPLTGQLPITADGRFIVKTPPRDPYPVDVLMFQGIRDNLFNLNEAYLNYLTLKAAGGDVRLLTYPWGHHYLSPNLGLLQETANSIGFYLDALPTLSDTGTDFLGNCGDVEAIRATVAWFNEKLRGRGNANNVITTGQDICLTLAPGDAITVPELTIGGQEFALTNPLEDVLGGTPLLLGANPLPNVIPLTTLEEDAVIAGIPMLTVQVGNATVNSLCQDSTDPILSIGTCDVIMYVGVGVIRNNQPLPELIDEQVMPVRGVGPKVITLSGIAQRLQAGDQLALMVYGQHPTFAGIFSRDLTGLVTTIKGKVELPLLEADGQKTLN